MSILSRWSLALALGCAAADASAQPASAPSAAQAPLTNSLTGAAKDAFALAQGLYEHGDFAGALAKYTQAYDLARDPRLLFNMALCARDLHTYASMEALLRRYEQEGAAMMTPDERAGIEHTLAEVAHLVGSVAVDVDQPGATVSVDSQVVGQTPLREALRIDLGEHAVVVKAEGFETFEQKVQVTGGEEARVAVHLTPRLQAAQLVVRADERAIVRVDGQLGTAGRFDGQLSPGTHEVEVTEAGKVPYKLSVDLHGGEVRRLDVALQDDKNRGPLIWPWIVGGVAVAAGAGIGGYFLFKSSDTTRPVPAGTFGTANLAWVRP